jgi:predicted transcriptional regulator
MMYTYIMERTQIYLDKKHTEALDRAARKLGRSRSDLIRAAIEKEYVDKEAEKERVLAILRETAGAWGPSDEDPEAFVDSLRTGRRLRDIDNP